MAMRKKYVQTLCGFLKLTLLLQLVACSAEKDKTADNSTPFFRALDSSYTGIQFANKLQASATFNMFEYMYFYNGAGLGAGDLNNDGRIDLVYAANQLPNRIYLNQGNNQFTDVTNASGIINDSAWTTGVSLVDVNSDGMLDIYLCRASRFKNLQGRNQLWVCTAIQNGIPQYAEQAGQYGIAFEGLSTQAAFFDYDRDGDLDMFLLNHAPAHTGRFAARGQFTNTYDSISGDRLYRRDGDTYSDVTKQSGIHSSAIGYGLGISIADINMDGWPDIYVGNDFHENDYLYINNGEGKFVDETEIRTMHTSQFTMGVDIGDATNDGFPEIISMDMLPATSYMQKRSLGDDPYDIYQMKLGYGYHPYATRNNLQLNRRNNMLSEIGLYAGVAATDWSWSCLWMDFDNDGWKDLFISNGIPKRLNDIDYVAFVGNASMQQKILSQTVTAHDFERIEQFPEIRLPNYFFKNNRDAKFTDISALVSHNPPTFSNGAVYADFDNDGDLDIAVNNIADGALIYENLQNDSLRYASVQLQLKGSVKNPLAVGARVVQYTGDEIRTYDQQPVHGYMSSMQIPMHIGIADTKTDSAFLIWPDGSYQPIDLNKAGRQPLAWTSGLPPFDFNRIHRFHKRKAKQMYDVAQQVGLNYEHTENSFPEFSREPLLPRMTSTEGPALAVGDINGDGLDDIFFGSSRGFKCAVYLQQATGRFAQMAQADLAADSLYEEVDALLTDVNGDKIPDLVVASGGNEYFGTSPYTAPRVYINSGRGTFTRKKDAFTNIHLVASCLAASDVNGDGAIDLFVGGRCVPFQYGQPPVHYLLTNDGSGKFEDVTQRLIPEITNAGMIKQVRWLDTDGDKDDDLIVAAEWQPLQCFENVNGKFNRKVLYDKNGLWNFIHAADLNSDGINDILVGNFGLNNRFAAAGNNAVKMYLGDFDNNGRTESIITYYLQNEEVLFAGKDELQKQLPALKKQYLYAADFAAASLHDVFPEKQLRQSVRLSASQLANGLLLSNGKKDYAWKPLHWMAQLTSYNCAVVTNANDDSLPDILLAGNYYDNSVSLGRNDADFGTLLINQGNGDFVPETLSHVILAGESRKACSIKVAGRDAIIVVRNNAPAALLMYGNE